MLTPKESQIKGTSTIILMIMYLLGNLHQSKVSTECEMRVNCTLGASGAMQSLVLLVGKNKLSRESEDKP